MDLKEIRKSIDDTDKKIALLLQKRMTLSKTVADYKIQNNITVHNEMREREVLENINHHVGSDYGKYIKPVYNSIMEASKAYQYSLMENTGDFVNSLKDTMEKTPKNFPESPVVACQGIPGSYSESAAKKMFYSPDLMYFETFESIFSAVEKGCLSLICTPIPEKKASVYGFGIRAGQEMEP